MRSSIAITLVITGGLLIALPTLATQRQLQRVAAFYEQQGGGALLPEELRPRPHSSYDWACLTAGAVLALVGAFAGRRTHSDKPMPNS